MRNGTGANEALAVFIQGLFVRDMSADWPDTVDEWGQEFARCVTSNILAIKKKVVELEKKYERVDL